MSATTMRTTSATADTHATRRSARPGVMLARAVRAEWTKLWSVNSTAICLLILFAVAVGLGVFLAGASLGSDDPMMVTAREDPIGTSLSGIGTSQFVLVVLGVLIISSEYGTGSIRASLIATPRRLTFLAAKGLVLAGVALAAGLVVSFTSFFAGQAILAREGYGASLGDPHALRMVIGGGLFLMASAMFGFAMGALLRATASGIAAAVAGLLVVPQLAALLPGRVGELVQTYVTTNAGSSLIRTTQAAGELGPWTGYLVFTLWWAVPLLIAAVLMQRRDV